MNRTIVAVIATLIALVVLAGTGSVGLTAAPNIQQLDVEIWLAQAGDGDGAGDPVRRLDPGTSEAQLVIHSDLGATDPKDFRAVVLDAGGIQVFRSETLSLGVDEQTTPISVTGKAVFQGYVNNVEAQKDELGTAVDAAITAMEGERAKDPCAQEPTERTQTSRVIDRVRPALGVREAVASPVARLLSFDSLAEGAQTDLTAAQTALDAVSTHGAAAIEKLEVPEDAPSCEDVEAPNWEPDWAAVRADLDAMNSEADTTVSKIDSALDLVDLEMDRSFPSTAVEEQCNQNTAQLQVADSDVPSDDFWFTVGTPGAPARLTNPEEPTSLGSLMAQPVQIYAETVQVAGVAHSTQVAALALDEVCLPVPDASISFSTPPGSPVTVESSEVTTDADGMATVTVNATDELGDGTATLNAQVDAAGASVGLTIIGPPAATQLRLGGAELEKIPNYGIESSVQVSAVVRDANGNDVADGSAVQFTIDPSGDHLLSDDGQATTSGGQASTNLVFGSAKGFYMVEVQSGEASDSQTIRVVGPPHSVQVETDPRVIVATSPIPDKRSSEFTVSVTDAQDPPAPAPDSTLLEFEFVNPEDADLAYFQDLTPEAPGLWSRAGLVDGETTATLVANQELEGFHHLEVRVTAIYEFGGVEIGSASQNVTVILQGELGEAIFLPLISK